MPRLFPLPAEIPRAERAQVPSKEAEMQFLGNKMELLKVIEAEGSEVETLNIIFHLPDPFPHHFST